MDSFEIINTNSGHSFGCYAGTDEDDAIRACCNEAGYPNIEAAEEVTGRASKLKAFRVVFADGDDDRPIRFDAAVGLMDDEIRERLHSQMSDCTAQEFFEAYVKAHAEKFDGEEFTVG